MLMISETKCINYKTHKLILINSILIGCFISINMITKIITSVISFNNNIIIFSVLLTLISIYYNKIKVKTSYNFVFISIMIILLISALRIHDNKYTLDYIVNFILYGMIFTYTMQFKFDFKYVLKTINYISYVYCLYLAFIIWPKIDNRTINIDFTMDLSYTSAIVIISILMYGLKKENKYENIFNIISLMINFNMIINKSTNRGVFLALGCYLLISYLYKSSKIHYKILKIIIISSISMTLLHNIEYILLRINKLLINFNINTPLVTKIVTQISSGDITSGRTILYDTAKDIIVNKPLLGNGVGYYESLNSGMYTHNIILDLLASIGIIGTVIVIGIIISGLVLVFREDISDKYKQIIIFLFSLSIPRLMISSTIWENHIFWMYIMYIIMYIFNKQKNIIR